MLPARVGVGGTKRLGTAVKADERTVLMAIVRVVALVLAEEGQESGRLVDGVHVEREEELETVRVVRVGCIEEPFDCSRGELCVGLL